MENKDFVEFVAREAKARKLSFMLNMDCEVPRDVYNYIQRVRDASTINGIVISFIPAPACGHAFIRPKFDEGTIRGCDVRGK